MAKQLAPMPENPPPGGMKQEDLRAELIGEFGFDPVEVESMKWIDLINEVGHQRHTRDAYSPSSLPLLVLDPETKDYILAGHAGAGPSSSERWMSCTASLAASRAFLETLTPNQLIEFAKANLAARQGTTAHAAAEVEARFILGLCDETEVEATLLELTLNPDDEGEAYDEEMAEYITVYTDLVKQYHDSGREVVIEKRVSAVVPLMTVDADGDQEVYEIHGSTDCGALPSEEENVLTVVDLKYGEGIWVDVSENPQIRIYALGLLSELADPETGELPELDHIEYVIVQPRMDGIKIWTESVDDLLDWRDEVLSPALTEALGGQKAGAAFRPSEVACQFCPARGTCVALTESRVEAAAELFDTVVEAEYEDGPGAFPETEGLSNERLGALYAQILGLTKIASDLRDEAQRRLYRGQHVPGFQLVSYTPPRKWAEDAEEELSQGGYDQLWTKKLVTPTQALKLLGDDADDITDLIEVPDKRPIIAPEGDRRKTWEGKAPEDMFDVEEDE